MNLANTALLRHHLAAVVDQNSVVMNLYARIEQQFAEGSRARIRLVVSARAASTPSTFRGSPRR
jgi:hypothetical protein